MESRSGSGKSRSQRTLLIVSIAGLLLPATLPFLGETVAAERANVISGRLPWALSFTNAVSAGSVAYVFGGTGAGGAPIDNILRFTFSTETIADTGAHLPSARFCAAAVWTGSVAYIFGGKDSGGQALSQIVKYDPSTGSVQVQGATLPSGRFCMAAVWDTQRSKAILFGGEDAGGNGYAQILEFTPGSGGFLPVVSSLFNNQATTGMSAVWTGTSALMFGGYTPGGTGDINRVSEYIPGASPTLKASLPTVRRRTSAIWDGATGNAFIFGGLQGGATYLNAIDQYNLAANTHTARAPLPSTRAMTSAAWSGAKAYLFGGESSSSSLRTDEIIRYNPGNDPPTARYTSTVNGLTINFDASTSTDPDGDPLAYEWDFGDGATAAGAIVSHTFACMNAPGSTTGFNVLLGVSDGQGGFGSLQKEIKPVDGSDADADGLPACREAQQGTTDNVGIDDFDSDGLTDLQESIWWANRQKVFCNNVACVAGDAFLPSPTQRDLYVEVDWYDGQDWLVAATQQVQNAYLTSGSDVRVHVDSGATGGGGTNLGAGGDVSFATAKANHGTRMMAERNHLFHYLVLACNRPTGAAYGEAEAPGDDAVIWNCALNAASRATDQAKEFMHEVGHNYLGAFVANQPACAGKNWANRAGDTVSGHHNLNLGHFNQPEDRTNTLYYCDTDNAQDVFAHMDDHNDDMVSFGPPNKNCVCYLPATWNAIRLDWAIDGSVPDCQSLLPVDDPTGLLPSCVADHVDWVPASAAAPAVGTQAGSLLLFVAAIVLGTRVRRRPA